MTGETENAPPSIGEQLRRNLAGTPLDWTSIPTPPPAEPSTVDEPPEPELEHTA